MRQTSAEMPVVGHDGRVPLSAHIGAIGEPPAGRDEQIGQVFRNMRSAMKVSRDTIARRLATNLSTIDNFEAGAVTALPHWKETERIVRGYCELLRIDPEPILWRVRDQLKAIASQARPSPVPPPDALQPLETPRSQGPLPLPPAAEAEPAGGGPARRRRRTRALFALSAPIALLLGVAILAQLAPGPVYRAVGLLPGSIESPARAGLDYVMLFTAPRRDGLKWIDVGDPRLRKADKLPTSTR
jgi:hypothetical protein